MTNLSVIENRISSLRKYLKILKGYQKYSRKEIQNNVDIKGMTERYLYLACQATIDLAEAVIAFKQFRKPTNMSESFDILYEEEIVPSELSEKMVKLVGFRNVIAHDYTKIDYDIVYDVLQNRLEDIEKFVFWVKKKT